MTDLNRSILINRVLIALSFFGLDLMGYAKTILSSGKGNAQIFTPICLQGLKLWILKSITPYLFYHMHILVQSKIHLYNFLLSILNQFLFLYELQVQA